MDEKAGVGLKVAVLMAGFTLLMTALGLACAATAHVPLARRSVHGRAAVALYKVVRCAGLAMMALPYVMDLLLLVFFIFLRCRRRRSGGGPNAVPPERLPAETVDWEAIRVPTFEYLAEVVRHLSRGGLDEGGHVLQEREMH